MISAPKPENEASRLTVLRAYGVLDTPPEERFDRITRLVSEELGVPISLVSLVDMDRQWFKSRVGLDATETPRELAFLRACDSRRRDARRAGHSRRREIQ